jgi:hypothetical protein
VDTDIGVTFAQDLAFWIREDKVEDFQTLNATRNLMSNILFYNGKSNGSEIREKDISAQYQKLFAKEFWRNYETRKETFNTEKMALTFKPYRNFVLATKDFIDTQIKKTIEKGESDETI